MKTKELRSPKSIKINKRISEAEPEVIRTKVCMPRSDQEYLSPMHIKLPKNKLRSKKEQKTSKNSAEFEQKTTKRKQKKKPMQTTNGLSLINENIELSSTIKEDKSALKLKGKTTEKTYRNSNRNHYPDKSMKYQFTEAQSLKTQSKLNQSSKKSTCSGVNIPQQQYMFIGDEFYLINNYYPTKRLLNTFRQLCTQQNQQSKFLTQDKSDKLAKQKIDLKKNNIFLTARKEIEMKNKVQKIVVIQRWWRKMIVRHNLFEQKSNPQMTVIHVSPIKNSYDSFEDINNITPIKPYLEDLSKEDRIVSPSTPTKNDNQEVIEIISFNSTQQMEDKPKKIEFKQEDISKMIGSYKLPQNGDVDSNQNQAIFNNYTHFRINDSDANHSQSEQSSENVYSPRKEDIYPLSPTKQPQNDEKQPNYDLLRQFQQATKIKELIDHRIIFQKGQARPLERAAKVGISTSILSIHNLLINFFHYYINKYRDQFLSLINMPFGHSINSRLKALSGSPLPEELEEDDSGVLYGLKDIIDDDKIEEYFAYLQAKQNKVNNSFSKANFELQRIHFKAVLDYFNEQLNQYRPYKQINGVPYPWNHSYKALTFYFVTEDNIAEVFEKAELKVLKSSALLCGIIIPEIDQNRKSNSTCQSVEQFMDQYQKENNGLILEHNESKEVKLIHDQVKSTAFESTFQTFSGVLLQVANEIMRELVLETAFEFPGFDFRSFIY